LKLLYGNITAVVSGLLTCKIQSHEASTIPKMSTYKIPKTQTVALVRRLGRPVEFVHDHPVKMSGRNEVLAKVLYTGVCQSGSSPPDPQLDLH
jgi:hypothetical protein